MSTLIEIDYGALEVTSVERPRYAVWPGNGFNSEIYEGNGGCGGSGAYESSMWPLPFGQHLYIKFRRSDLNT